MRDVLLVFARYPETGKCKTRLIPELGAEGAARLHEQMTHRTLEWVRELAGSMKLRVEVVFAGGDKSSMATRFGDDLDYRPQSGVDLGQRLQTAFLAHIQQKAGRIVAVGTDCPQLDARFVQRAFDRLTTHDVCIAPAADGGYVLLGIGEVANPSLRADIAERIFQQIEWGSELVLAQTLKQVGDIRATCSLLPSLADVDTPQDLCIWRKAIAGHIPQKPLVTVVVPTLDEEPMLARALESARADRRAEIVVVGAGRVAEALHIASEQQVQFLQSLPGRGAQMNLGALHASGERLLFLHADTILPVGYVDSICEALDCQGVVGGAFSLRIDSSRWIIRCLEKGIQLRSKYRQMPYGDQGLFVRKALWAEVGGYAALPIMEDYEFVRRLRRRGRIALSRQSVITSSRRWQRLGFLKTTLINQLMIAGYHLGISPQRLSKFYRRGSLLPDL